MPRASGNAGFAKRARNFANRVVALPGFPILPIACFAAAMLMIIVGAFGTGQMPLTMRAGFWGVLLGWNFLKWQIWFALLVRRPTDWSRASAIGAVVLNLPLPFEIALSLRLFGIVDTPGLAQTWAEALAISMVVFLVLIIAGIHRRAEPAPTPTPAAAPPVIAPDGLLARAGITDPTALQAIEAEDHYCRLHLAGGRSLLVLHRFGDALKEVANLDGAQVHRGAWVSARDVAGAERDGRRWLLLLADGARIPVSASFTKIVRARGWLRLLRAP
ncbi:MAG: LytTR family DNA-binding domain-containing protein [Sphingomonas bacterium]